MCIYIYIYIFIIINIIVALLRTPYDSSPGAPGLLAENNKGSNYYYHYY